MNINTKQSSLHCEVIMMVLSMNIITSDLYQIALFGGIPKMAVNAVCELISINWYSMEDDGINDRKICIRPK